MNPVISLGGKWMCASKIGLIASLSPLHVPAHALTKFTADIPSASLFEIHTQQLQLHHTQKYYIGQLGELPFQNHCNYYRAQMVEIGLDRRHLDCVSLVITCIGLELEYNLHPCRYS